MIPLAAPGTLASGAPTHAAATMVIMDDPVDVAARETHLSRLFFTPDRVYKLLRPVTLPFVDFADTERRLAAVVEEYERNRALSPDVYLGLADVREHGELVDRMIVMKRLPADRALDRLLDRGEAEELIPTVGRLIARIHADLVSLRGEAAECASLDAVAGNWEDNLVAIGPYVGSVIDPAEYHDVAARARAYMAGRAPLFAQRIEDGWVRDGHGDLRAEHIYCTDDGPRLIDCVAFDDRLRISDVLADVAFLAMDLDRVAGSAAAVSLMRAWNEFTNEHHPSSLAHFYVAYRAHVRCKIACLRHGEGDPAAADEARRYHRLARRHLEHGRVRVVLVGGGPGAGKSTISEAVARDLGAAWLRSDEVRKDIAGVGHETHSFAAPGEGLYTADISARTLDELARQTEHLLAHGVSVVLDATWSSAADREALRTLASESAAQLTELCCSLPAAVAKERIARRMASIHNPSDATPELVDYMAARFDDWPEATVIDTGGTIAAALDAARDALTPRGVESARQPERFTVDLKLLRDAMLVRRGLDR